MKMFGTARLGSDMEIRFMPDKTPVGQVSLAFKLGIKDKQTGEYKTQWVSASLFGKRAETLAPMLKKGALHGFFLRDIHIEEYEKNGEKKVIMKAIIEDVELCGKQSAEPAKSEPKSSGSFLDMDDDIVF